MQKNATFLEIKTNDERLFGINMDELISFDVINSAPQSECEDSEIFVLAKTPAFVSSLEFTVEEALFSPTGISSFSSPKFVEMVLSAPASAIVQEKPEKAESKKKTLHKPEKNKKCKECGLASESLTFLSCKCGCNT